MEAGSKLKHYRILSRLGEGGMGVVYRAEDTRLGRTVALKVFPPDLALDEERVTRFEREARAASSISHPGVATLYEFDQEGDTAFLTMEFVEGVTLRELMQGGCLLLPRLLDCLCQVAEALSAAHRKGIIHRDLKPENVMAADSGFYKILDFGLARIEYLEKPEWDEHASPTQVPTLTRAITGEGKVIGTIEYMSPEQVQGFRLDARSDIFSFGTLLYELATGKSPFKGLNVISTFHAIVHEEPEPMVAIRADLPPELDRIAAKCLAKEPSDRYQTAADLVVDLRSLRRESDSGSRTLRYSQGHTIGRPRTVRKSAAAWIIGGAAVIVLALVSTLWLRTGSPESTSGTISPPVDLASSRTHRNRIVVPFFANKSGDAEADWLSQGLPEMLTTDLVRAKGMEVISTQRLYDLLAAAGKSDMEELDRTTITELARWAGAGVVVSGSIFKVGDHYRIDVQAYDTTGGQVLAASRVEGQDVFGMADRLSADLRQGLQVAAGENRGIQEITTSSPQAYRFYSQAMKLYEELQFDRAAGFFRQALDVDPEFALARLRLGLALILAGDPEEGIGWIKRATDLAERMPDRERLLTQGLAAFFVDRDLAGGEARFKELAERHPQDVESRFWKAQALVSEAGDLPGAIQALREALKLDPNNALATAVLASHLESLDLREDAEAIRQDYRERNRGAAGRRIDEIRIPGPRLP